MLKKVVAFMRMCRGGNLIPAFGTAQQAGLKGQVERGMHLLAYLKCATCINGDIPDTDPGNLARLPVATESWRSTVKARVHGLFSV